MASKKTTGTRSTSRSRKTIAKSKGDSKTVAPMMRRRGQAQRVTADQRRQLIATAAYYRAEARGFASGHELQDWLSAEAEIDAAIGGV